MQYFAMVSGALFVPYLVIQRCKQTTTATGAGATYNYLNQAALGLGLYGAESDHEGGAA